MCRECGLVGLGVNLTCVGCLLDPSVCHFLNPIVGRIQVSHA